MPKRFDRFVQAWLILMLVAVGIFWTGWILVAVTRWNLAAAMVLIVVIGITCMALSFAFDDEGDL